eukprot:5299945-Amphidinium_carterae.1
MKEKLKVHKISHEVDGTFVSIATSHMRSGDHLRTEFCTPQSSELCELDFNVRSVLNRIQLFQKRCWRKRKAWGLCGAKSRQRFRNAFTTGAEVP